MSCGSPMPRGERIAKPAEWGTPIRPVFHSLRGEPNPEASMRTRFALVALAVALSTACGEGPLVDRKSTRLNSSHDQISYAVFCLKKKNKQWIQRAGFLPNRRHSHYAVTRYALF